MLRYAVHAVRRMGAPDNEIALIAKGKVEKIGVLAVDNGEEDGVVLRTLAFPVRAMAED